MTQKALRCISWVAVSSEEQAREEKASLPDQQRGNLQFIESIQTLYAGYVGVYMGELKVTDSRKITLFEDARRQYPAYQQLFDMVQSKSVDLIVAHKWDRVGRTESLVMTIRDFCMEHGVIVVVRESMPNTLDIAKLRQDEGYRVAGMIQAWGAGREVRDISRKVKTGRTNAVIKSGTYMGEWPYGYKWKYDPDGNREIVVDDEAAKIIRFIYFDLFLGKGLGRPSITIEMNRLGIPAPRGGKWGISSIETLLQKARTYAGYIEFNRRGDQEFISIRGKHPPIITEDEMAIIERELASRAYGRRAMHPFTGICICDECGAPMYTKINKYKSKRTGEITTYYFMTCWPCGFGVSEKNIDAALRQTIDQITQDGTAILTDDEPDQTVTALSEEITRINRQINDTIMSMERLIDALESGDISGDRLYKRMEERQRQLSELRMELAEKSRELAEYQNSGMLSDRLEEIKSAGHELLDIAREEPLEVRRWLRSHFRLWLKRGGVVRVKVL